MPCGHQKLMDNLVEQYGPEKGKEVYYAMENMGKITAKARRTLIANAWRKCKSGIAQMPVDITKQIPGNEPKKPSIKARLRELWKACKGEFEKEKKEHPSFTDKQIKQIIEDHRAQHSVEVSHGSLPTERVAHHEIGMKEYAELTTPFLKEGEWRANGIPYKYTWDTILKYKDTFKGKEFFLEHNENTGLEFGIVNEVEPQKIEGENWLVAKVRVPESKFTEGILERIQNGLIKYVSSTHNFTINPNDSERKVLTIKGKALSAVREPEVEGARITGITRHIRAS